MCYLRKQHILKRPRALGLRQGRKRNPRPQPVPSWRELMGFLHLLGPNVCSGQKASPSSCQLSRFRTLMSPQEPSRGAEGLAGSLSRARVVDMLWKWQVVLASPRVRALLSVALHTSPFLFSLNFVAFGSEYSFSLAAGRCLGEPADSSAGFCGRPCV